MTTMASQLTSLTVVYSTVYPDADQRKHQSSVSLAFVWGIHRDRWIPRTKGQLRGKGFHLMASSWGIDTYWYSTNTDVCICRRNGHVADGNDRDYRPGILSFCQVSATHLNIRLHLRVPHLHFDGLVQERRNSTANALDLRLCGTNSWIRNAESCLKIGHQESSSNYDHQDDIHFGVSHFCWQYLSD